MALAQRLDRIVSLLAAKRLALFLFFGLAVFLIPETLGKTAIPFLQPGKFLLLSLLWLNLACCTLKRWTSLSRPVLLLHLGCLITIIGSLVGHKGYVATINIHEGKASDRAYRWDQKADVPLGFALRIKKINREYYPVPVKVGVLDKAQKAGLFQLQTGESFTYKDLAVKVDSLDIATQALRLSIYSGDRLVTHFNTLEGAESADFPFSFKLVAFRNPVLKRVWVDMGITGDGEEISGISEVNDPLIWRGIRFFHTGDGLDANGLPYAGIQIVKDPGVPLVYLGFAVIILGCILRLPTVFKKQPKEGKDKY